MMQDSSGIHCLWNVWPKTKIVRDEENRIEAIEQKWKVTFK